jgi:hypothetical protein
MILSVLSGYEKMINYRVDKKYTIVRAIENGSTHYWGEDHTYFETTTVVASSIT